MLEGLSLPHQDEKRDAVAVQQQNDRAEAMQANMSFVVWTALLPLYFGWLLLLVLFWVLRFPVLLLLSGHRSSEDWVQVVLIPMLNCLSPPLKRAS